MILAFRPRPPKVTFPEHEEALMREVRFQLSLAAKWARVGRMATAHAHEAAAASLLDQIVRAHATR